MDVSDRMARAMGDVATLVKDERLSIGARAELMCAFNILMLVKLPATVGDKQADEIAAKLLAQETAA